MDRYFTVYHDTSSGVPYDDSFPTLVEALRFYLRLPESTPYKSIGVTDPVRGDLFVLASDGDNWVKKIGLSLEYSIAYHALPAAARSDLPRPD